MANLRIAYVLLDCLFMILYAEGSSRIQRTPFSDWGYTLHNGPSTWKGICKIGKKQSPINIVLGSTVVKNFPSFSFDENYLRKQKFFAKNNGHTIYVALEESLDRPVIYGGGLGGKFIFEQLHFHWESEHEFDGKRADLEMHIVHYNAKYQSFAEASAQPDGIVVLAVIFNKSEKTDRLTEEFLNYTLEASSTHDLPPIPPPPDNYLPEEKTESNSGYFALRDLLPKYVSRFFRYEGSLTTPSCAEVVQWTVFINRLPVSSQVLTALRKLRDHDGNVLSENFRPPQSLNGRDVYIQIANCSDKPNAEFQTGNGVSALISTSLPIYLILLTRLNY